MKKQTQSGLHIVVLQKTIVFFIACLLIGVMAFFLFQFMPPKPKPPSTPYLPPQFHWGVSSGHPLATHTGMEILERGGNAMDAAVAVAYTLSVVEPYACGLGGGGIMLIYRRQDRKVRVVDYRETAPSQYNSPWRNRNLIGIPGFTAGMDYLMRQYGTLPRSVIMKRALEYARNGFQINHTLAELLSQYQNYKISPQITPQFYNHGKLLQKGDLLFQEELGEELANIIQYGSPGFYQQRLAQFLTQDLLDYRIRETAAVKGTFCGYDVYAPPPPGGGMSLLEMLKLAEISGAARPLMSEEDRSLLLFKGMAITYADRKKYLGDPLFGTEIPGLINQPDYLRREWQSYDNRFNVPANDEEQSTTHFTVVDSRGNWVSCTQTLGDFFGSGVMQRGFFLNNSLNKFSLETNSPNRIAPGKRPFSYMSPALLFRANADRPFLALGSPGGRRIPAILTQMLIHHLRDGLSLTAAVQMPRYFINPGRSLYFEKIPSGNFIVNLKKRGFQSVTTAKPLFYGAIQALEMDREGWLIGAADYRRSGSFSCRNLNQDVTAPPQ